MNGGPSTILTVCEALKHKTPVLAIEVRNKYWLCLRIKYALFDIFQGTGRAADLVASEYEFLYGSDKERSVGKYEEAKVNEKFKNQYV